MAAYDDPNRMDDERWYKSRALVAALKQRHWPAFATDPGIVGAAFGRRSAHGELTDEPALVVYVVRKTPQRFLPLNRLLPRRAYVGGDCVEVDVVETGVLYPLAFTARERPAPAGVSIGNANEVSAGTLGAQVVDNTDGTNCILSNNHVIARQNAGAVGERIVQQGLFDGGSSPADDIATLKRVGMIAGAGNRIDAAIAQILNDAAGNPTVVDQVKDNLIPTANADHPAIGLLFAGGCNRTIMNPIRDVLGQLNIAFPAGGGAVATAELGMNVEKVGRTTEYTTSTVTEIDATVTINYDFGPATFDSQITTMWMSDRGDSGSVVYRGGAGGATDNCGCGTTSAAEGVLGTDLREERAMADVVRDKFLRQTRLGRYGIDLFFRHEEALLDRFRATSLEDDDVAQARRLFTKYRQQAREAFAQGEKAEQTITDQHLRDARGALKRAQQYMSREEQDASERLFKLGQEHARGKNARELLALLNDEKLFEEVRGIVADVPFLRGGDAPC